MIVLIAAMLMASLPVFAFNTTVNDAVYCPLQKKWVSPTPPKVRFTFDSGQFCASTSTKDKAARALFLAAVAITEDNFFAAISRAKQYSSPLPKNNSELLAGSKTQPLVNGSSSSQDKRSATAELFSLPQLAETFAVSNSKLDHQTISNIISRSIPNSPTRGPPTNI